jgi:hypothetical protein
MREITLPGDRMMPTKKSHDAKSIKKPAKAKNLPKSSYAGQSARASAAYVRTVRPPVARAGR